MCSKYILLPQTYGSYSNDEVKKKALKVINKAYKVYVRDRKSKEYVIQIGVQQQVDLSIDIVFSLPYDKRKYHIKEGGFNCRKLVFAEPPGLGKTMVACGLGLKAVNSD